MAQFLNRTWMQMLVATLLSVLPLSAFASNGMFLTGYGTESVLMGGADVAVARDAFAANNNPSGMIRVENQALEIEGALIYMQELSHTDSFGNYRKPAKASSSTVPYANGAYARRFANTPYAAGVALVVQGGVGWRYSGMNTIFGTRDDIMSQFTIIKLAPAIAWKVNDDLSVGVALGINYLSGAQDFFPNTSDAGSGFSGFRLRDVSGIGLNSKWGLQYHPSEDVTIGMTYGTQVSMPLKGGNLRINYTNTVPGQGVVRYDNAKLTGMRLPEELALGIAFRPTPRLLVSLQNKWYNWSDALNKLHLTATNPRNAGAPAVAPIPVSTLDLKDQNVIEIGFAYAYDKDTVLMAGINHGSRPMPDQNLNPIFAIIPSRHYTLGMRRKIDKEWAVTGGALIGTMQTATYNSPVFGPGANEKNYGIIFQFSVDRHW